MNNPEFFGLANTLLPLGRTRKLQLVSSLDKHLGFDPQKHQLDPQPYLPFLEWLAERYYSLLLQESLEEMMQVTGKTREEALRHRLESLLQLASYTKTAKIIEQKMEALTEIINKQEKKKKEEVLAQKKKSYPKCPVCKNNNHTEEHLIYPKFSIHATKIGGPRARPTGKYYTCAYKHSRIEFGKEHF